MLARLGIGAKVIFGLAALLLMSAFALNNIAEVRSQDVERFEQERSQVELASVRVKAASSTALLQVELSRVGIDGSPTSVSHDLIADWRAQLDGLATSLRALKTTDSASSRSKDALYDVLTGSPKTPEVTGTYLDQLLMATQFQAALVADGANGSATRSAEVGDVVTEELFNLGIASSLVEIALPDAAGSLDQDSFFVARRSFVSALQLMSPTLNSLDDLQIGALLTEAKSAHTDLGEAIDNVFASKDFKNMADSSRSALDLATFSISGSGSITFQNRTEMLKAQQKLVALQTTLATEQLHLVEDRVALDLMHAQEALSKLRWYTLGSILGAVMLIVIPFLASRRTEASLREKAFTDPLTGLLNREGLDLVVKKLHPTLDAPVGLMHIDLDRFKPVNDTYGHQIGDQVLVEVSDRLKAMTDIGAAGDAWAARAGGDEFIMVTQFLDEAELRSLASRIISGLEHFEFEEVSLRVGASVGIAVCVEPTDPKDLILEADLALYQAKRNGRGQSATYERTTGEFIRTVRKSIDEKRLQVAYHPQIDLHTGKVVGSEALARIVSADGEVIPANKWIQIIEWMSGSDQLFEALVSSINEDVASGARFPGRIWCNISPHDLARHRGTHKIITQLAKTGLPPQRLGIELSESEKIENPGELAHAVNALSDAGIAVALDNFGVRNMPLGYLVQLPVQRVKLDRALLAGNQNRVAPARRVTAAVVAMANDLGIEIVAGGVENAAEIRTLRDLKIGIAQGYLFGKPLEWDRNHGRPLDRREPQNFLSGPGDMPQQSARLDSSGGF